jgi:hypothetical protein
MATYGAVVDDDAPPGRSKALVPSTLVTADAAVGFSRVPFRPDPELSRTVPPATSSKS